MISCALRRLPGGERPKVVFQAGANEYIMKPFDKDIVEEKFQEIGSDLMPRSVDLCAVSGRER
jgi:hypothetical protein